MLKRLIITTMLAFSLLPIAVASSNSEVYAIDLFNDICNGQNQNQARPTSASGTDVCKEKNGAKSGNPIVQTISITIEILSFIIGITAVIMIVINGFKFVTSQGDTQGVAQARSGIIYALVGLVVAILAGTLVALVLSKL